jgi:hypothetical protein
MHQPEASGQSRGGVIAYPGGKGERGHPGSLCEMPLWSLVPRMRLPWLHGQPGLAVLTSGQKGCDKDGARQELSGRFQKVILNPAAHQPSPEHT